MNNVLNKRNVVRVFAATILLAFASSAWAGGSSENRRTRTIVDQVGNTVRLPEKVERVVIASVWPLASVYCLSLGSDTLVGLDPAIISAGENSMLKKVVPNISSIPSSFSQNGLINAEELLKLKPDVVLYASAIMEDYEVSTQAGVPAVGFSLSIKDFNAVDTINSWVEQLGAVMGVDLSDSEYVRYGERIQALVASRVNDIPEGQKPRCLFIHGYGGGNSYTIPGTTSWADYWITASGGRNVVDSYSGNGSVTMEQIYAWNPDYIFIDNFNPLLPEDLYENKAGTANWQTVKAVANRQVKKVPLGMYRWYVTCSDSPLMLLWMAKQNQPDVFADIDLDAEMKSFYKQFYNIELSDEDIASIYNPVREASAGIK